MRKVLQSYYLQVIVGIFLLVDLIKGSATNGDGLNLGRVEIYGVSTSIK
jgi:hypothetical protein